MVLRLLSLSVTWVTVVTPYFPKHPPPLAYMSPLYPVFFFFSSILLTIPSSFSWLGLPLLPNLSSRSATGLFFSTYIHLYWNNYQMQSSCYFCGMHSYIQATVNFTSLPRYFTLNISNVQVSLTQPNPALQISENDSILYLATN